MDCEDATITNICVQDLFLNIVKIRKIEDIFVIIRGKKTKIEMLITIGMQNKKKVISPSFIIHFEFHKIRYKIGLAEVV